MESYSTAGIHRLAIAVAIVALIGLIFIALFYTVGGPFGTLNDIFVALQGILTVALSYTFYPFYRTLAPRLAWLALVIGIVGAILVPIGSGLVMAGITGWFFAGLLTTFGFACVGVWLLSFGYALRGLSGFPRSLARLGIIAGWISAIGLLAVPAILAGSDNMDSAGWPALTALFVGGLGWNILYPLWCLLLGRSLSSHKLDLDALAVGQ
jgi:hypothetical protein